MENNTHKNHEKQEAQIHGEDHKMHNHVHQNGHKEHETHMHKAKHEKHQHDHSHAEHHKMMMEDFKKRFTISVVLTVPILLLSPLIQQFLGFTLVFAGDKYLLLALSAVVYFYGGRPFLGGMIDELRKKLQE